MLYYELKINCESEKAPETDEFVVEDPVQESIERQIKSFNEKNYDYRIDRRSAFIYYYGENKLFAAIICDVDGERGREAAQRILETVRKIEGIISAEIESVREITGREMRDLYEEARGNVLFPYSPGRGMTSRAWGYLDSNLYAMDEEVVEDIDISYEKAQSVMDSLMADKSLREEIDRIYDESNSNVFYGFPVHYVVSAANSGAAKDIVKFMIQALHFKNRIPGIRMTTISKIDVNKHDPELERAIQNSSGTAMMIELQGDEEDRYASDLTRIGCIMADFIRKYSKDTLFFLYQNNTTEGFSSETLSRLDRDMDFIEIKEGRGDKKEACAYMERAIGESRYKDLMDENAFSYLKNRKSFHASDVRAAVDDWERMCLREKAYTAYGKCVKARHKKRSGEKKDAYDQLQKMVGLDEVKTVVDDMIAFYSLQKERERHFKGKSCISRHMIFTGNPGCAKTTVARLIAEILLERGIITSGNFVECGRGDLVGRFVGWTAKTVQAKFSSARGGILFIDEAYSLVDNSKSFGDEAINTIVQEMENHRDDVIVIFAGYPEPMKEFIERNDGLKSRIAFHIAFPDYNEDEMISILSMMAEERGLSIDDCEDKCRSILRNAITCENFGNGRFARNLLEHAMMKQAGRLAGGGLRKKYSKEIIARLVPDDFEDAYMPDKEKNNSFKIGFATE